MRGHNLFSLRNKKKYTCIRIILKVPLIWSSVESKTYLDIIAFMLLALLGQNLLSSFIVKSCFVTIHKQAKYHFYTPIFSCLFVL